MEDWPGRVTAAVTAWSAGRLQTLISIVWGKNLSQAPAKMKEAF